jgi:hypothetical protein
MATKKTIKTIRERLDGKMWKAVQAMIDGLIKQSKREDFKIDMGSFGDSEIEDFTGKVICFGCAATCAVQEITKKNLTAKHMVETKRAAFLKLVYDDMDYFEIGINELRNGGDLYHLKKYLGIPKEVNLKLVKNLPFLTTDTWRENLPAYQKFADLLKEKDL